MSFNSAKHDGYGIALTQSSAGVSTLWTDGDVTWYSPDLAAQRNYQVQASDVCDTSDPNVVISMSSSGQFYSIDRRLARAVSISSPTTRINEVAIASSENLLVAGYMEVVRVFDLRKMQTLALITEAHSDDIVDIKFWNELIVTASQDSLSCFIDYTKGDDGIVHTVNMGKPISMVGVINKDLVSFTTDDSAFQIYAPNTEQTVSNVADLRVNTLATNFDGATVLRGTEINKKVVASVALPNGEIDLFNYVNDNSYRRCLRARCHEGIVRDYRVNGTTMYTTGEDGKVCVFDMKTPPLVEDVAQQPQATNELSGGMRQKQQRRQHTPMDCD
ncbi:hypothetical protein EIN_379320 [Entamoeba invadens IP1]|uniref:WD repeat-containing protein n=1 Tax=Entamoeba invadens IP1 TaxID=370355 RepID=A0A0A1UAQ8_ENTIV|nr:hypothetical protein EIN_379320 [Entamoeba invadens IP1]ELP92065.1 hypothetical protein EIN_379320 [Entamoeba invadens IP1]|eukprot:XP_004258836.1 hypothetical protein EIN_379320 [Entamoeba invadens IP1]